jgi:hypothetical protein
MENPIENPLNSLMQKKLLLRLLACCLLLAASVLLFSKTKKASPPPEVQKSPTVKTVVLKTELPETSEKTALTLAPATLEAPAPSHTALLEEINEAAVTYNASALPRIQPYLTHSDPEIREAAKNGMIVLGDSAAAPLLREASRKMATPQEATALLEAADYMELPSGSILLKARSDQKKAEAQAHPTPAK